MLPHEPSHQSGQRLEQQSSSQQWQAELLLWLQPWLLPPSRCPVNCPQLQSTQGDLAMVMGITCDCE